MLEHMRAWLRDASYNVRWHFWNGFSGVTLQSMRRLSNVLDGPTWYAIKRMRALTANHCGQRED